MECARCQGMMVEDHSMDMTGPFLWMRSWRCLNCGAVEDPLICHNRKLQESGEIVSPLETEIVS